MKLKIAPENSKSHSSSVQIPFIICTDNIPEVTWIAEGDQAMDPDPSGSACIPGSANYNQLLVEVMSNDFGEEGKWNGR
jgi:hypothetical protein